MYRRQLYPKIYCTLALQKLHCIDILLIHSVSKHENPELLKNLAQEKIETHSNSVYIYIDAPKTQDNVYMNTESVQCISIV